MTDKRNHDGVCEKSLRLENSHFDLGVIILAINNQNAGLSVLTFRSLSAQEAPVVFSLIISRIDWMNAQGLLSWNTTDYLQRYPLSYYETMAADGLLYGLIGSYSSILSAGVLLRNDERWPDGAKAIYLHNFVSTMNVSGAGSIFLEKVELFASKLGITLVRLDVADGNAAMNNYYQSRGYYAVGTCHDGPYHGILREKRLAD